MEADPATVWVPAAGYEHDRGSQIAETTVAFPGRQLRLGVRRQPAGADGDAQLSFDDLDGWRFHAIVTHIDVADGTAVQVEAHHRARGNPTALRNHGQISPEKSWSSTSSFTSAM